MTGGTITPGDVFATICCIAILGIAASSFISYAIQRNRNDLPAALLRRWDALEARVSGWLRL